MTRLTLFFVQTKPSLRTGRTVSKSKPCAKKIPKKPPPAGNGSALTNVLNIAEETQAEKILAERVEPVLLLENRGPLSLQNVERNRDSACHEVFFEERNLRDKCEPSVSKNGQFHFVFEL
jgi:cyclin-A